MSQTVPEHLVERVRAELKLEPSVLADAYRVARLDQSGSDYYLMVFGKPGQSVAVAAVGANGEIQSSARLPGTAGHSSLDVNEARRRSGLVGSTEARLVWRPCQASRSSLYPLWEIRSGPHRVYVDFQGVVWKDLECSRA